MKIGIISGSIREGRKSTVVAQWVAHHAEGRDAHYEVLELADFRLPLLTSAVPPNAAGRQYETPEVRAWSEAIDACDAFVFVTPEYNHSLPAGLKNAVDSLGPEWVGKPVAFVGYGAAHAVRAIEAWRLVAATFRMYDAGATVGLNIFTDFDDDGLVDEQRHLGSLRAMMDELETITAKLA